MRRTHFLFIATIVLLALSACSANGDQETPEDPVAPPGTVVEEQVTALPEMPDENGSESEAEPERQETQPAQIASDVESPEELPAVAIADDSSAVERPAWQHLPLTNARTGESFTLADFEGKTVFVEPMATWCGNCRQQLKNVKEAQQQLASDEVVFIALSVETNIDPADLAGYADGAGFNWLFAVVTPDLLVQLAEEFGRGIANPPATPHFIIRADGTNNELVTGIEPADQIVSQIRAVQG